MASVILELALSGIIKSDVIVSWLGNRLGKEDVPDVLANGNHLKNEFVLYFLGYLREQAISHIHELQHSGLTPRKNVSNVKSASRDMRSPESANSPLSRTKLCFGSAERAHDGQPLECTVQRIESWSRRRSRQSTWGRQDPQRAQNKKLMPEQKSQQKFSLGNFIVSSEKDLNQKETSKLVSNAKIEDQTTGSMPNLNDQSVFPPVGSTFDSKRNQRGRRITPTPVKYRKTCLPGAAPDLPMLDDNLASSDFIFSKSPTSDIPSNLHLERELLKEEREKMQQTTPLSSGTTMQVWPSCNDLIPGRFLEIDSGVAVAQPHPNDVKFREKIVILAEIYSGCIRANLAPCLVSELHFIIQLLTVVGKGEPDLFFDNGTEPFFCSISNCVYFATQVLWFLRKLLSLLDRGTLRLLLENPRLELFSPQLTVFLKEACDHTLASISLNVRESLIPVGSVAFQSDTDNRNNFVSDQEFHTFRRKRDLFYEVLREWEANHLSSGWSMAAIQGGRIRSLVLGGETTASEHLARLFLAQLITMCKGDVQIEDCNFLDGPEPLTALKQANPEKYKRLQERFVMPYHSAGPCPLPSFPGYQEFFKDFIVAAASHSFNQQLIDGFCYKIHEMNAFQLVLVDGENDEERKIDADSRNQFLSCLLTLRLLAKFLGFIHFSPYKANERIPENVLASHIQLRSNTNPPIDIITYLKDAIETKRTVLVVPWIVEFLSMMDPVAPFLPYFRKPLEMIFLLYRSEMLTIGHPEFSYNQFFILVLLGWLFEIVSFWQAVPLTDTDEAPFSADNSFNLVSVNSLDTVAIIDQSIVYTCCPYLAELRTLLVEFAKGTNSRSGTVRKIKPVTTEHTRPVQSSTKQMELQLEEHFFHNHPVSLKRMVEFVTDRISSNVIKHVRSNVVGEVRLEASRQVSELGESLELADVSQKSKMLAAKKIVELSQKVAEEVRGKTHEYANSYCPKRASAAVPVLLPDETLQEVSDTCVKIVQRAAMKKISQWATTNITSDVFYKELLNELQKIIKNSSSYKSSTPEIELVPVISNEHNEDVPAPADILISAKEILKRLYSRGDLNESDVEEVVGVVQATKAVIESRSDLTPLAFKTLIQLTVDIAAGILIQHPGLMASSLEDIFIQFWRLHSAHVIGPLATIICSRNLQLLTLAGKSNMSFVTLEGFLNKCIKVKLIKTDVFRKQCFLALKQPWPKQFLLQLANFVHAIIERDPVVSNPRPDLDLPQLDRWLSKFCQTFEEL